MASPKTATTEKKLSSLKRDHFHTKTHWMLVHEKHVTLVKQKNGEPCEGMIDIPKKVFEKFIKLYETEQ